jgi:RNA polymerase sigma-70 factor (family 1)
MLGDRTHTVNDTLLLSQLRNGTRSAFDALYERYKVDVFNEAYKRLSDPDQAKDIVQDIFTSLWVKGTTTIIENLPGYLYISIRNNVYRFLQQQQRFTPIADLLTELGSDQNRADAKVLQHELARTYQQLIERLPEQQRIIYRMRYEENLSTDEIAQQLNISNKTVRNHLGRALARLKSAFFILQIIVWFTHRS